MPRLGRHKTTMLVVMALLLLVLAWYQGGERAVRPIVEDVAVPEGAL